MPKVKEQVLVGVGALYRAPVGSTVPNHFAAPPSPWVHVGYTDGGVTLEYDTEQQDIEVDQELDPIDTIVTRRNATLATTLAQMNAENLQLAYGGGTITPVDPDSIPASGDEYDQFTPPEVGEDDKVMLLLDGVDEEDRPVRLIIREAKREGGSTINFRKAEKASVSVTFRALKPAATDDPTPIFPPTLEFRVKNLPAA
jgi:hypothetical protein